MPRNNSIDKFYSLFRRRVFSTPMADLPLVGKKGQVLVEALVALSILTIGFLSAFALLGRSLSANRASAQSYTATYLAAEGIEVARNIVDGNGIQGIAWNSGFADGDYEVEYNSFSMTRDRGRFLTYGTSTNTYGYDSSIQTPFKRTIKVVLVGSDEIKINSVVSWVGLGGGSFNVDLENHFMNWRD